MKRIILKAETNEDYQAVCDNLSEGWVLDPNLTDGKPLRLENSTVWPLMFFESSEESVQYKVKREGEFDDVVEVREVPHGDEVARLIGEGFTVQSIYAKNTILIKRRSGGENC